MGGRRVSDRAGPVETVVRPAHGSPRRLLFVGGGKPLRAVVMSELFDAVVIGGGPGGSTTAVLLARAGWSVALIERKAFPRRKLCGEYLSATNQPLFDRLGIAEEFQDQAG